MCANVLGMTSTDTKADFGARLDAARIAAGAPSCRTLEREALVALGGFAPSNTTIAKYHHGGVDPRRAQLELVVFFATRYGVSLSDLSPTLAERFHGSREVLTTSIGWSLWDAAGLDPYAPCAA